MRKSLNILLAAGLLSVAACSQKPVTSSVAGADVADSADAAPKSLVDETMAWREGRVERLKRTNGWLSLVGPHWLEPGDHSLGSADDNDVQLTTGPAHIGRIRLADGKVTLTPQAEAGITVDGMTPDGPVELAPDSSGTPSQVAFDGQEAGFTVIERSGRLGLRVKDAEAKTRTGFLGIDYFDVTPEWRFDARFEAHPPGQTIKIASVINTLDDMANPGRVIFTKDGQEYSLEAVDEGDGELFLIFADRTNGKTTYGPGRFLYAHPAKDGHTIVDFNQAYNPPCAFNAYSTCPLPPPENRLNLTINAGEKKYRGSLH